MSNKTWLMLDVSYLGYRAFYRLGDLSYEGVKTGAIYGLFRAVIELQDRFATDSVAWCFDGGHAKRSQIWSSYKANRKSDTDDEETKQARHELRQQLTRLRTECLPAVGYRNVFHQEGYEADDVIAWLCDHLPHGDEAVIVASDQDLYQLLSDRVVIYSPTTKRLMSQKVFERNYHIAPSMWSDVKALAGCPGDGVEGIRGVGEAMAVRFLTGTLSPDSKAFQRIVSFDGRDRWKMNLHLVRLPFRGCGPFSLVDDQLTPQRWDQLMESLGMKTLVGRARR